MQKYIWLIVFFCLNFNPQLQSMNPENLTDRDYDDLLIDILDRYLLEIRAQDPRSHVINYQFKNFSGHDFSYVNLSGANFVQCDFSGCDLRGTDFSDCVLRGCNFAGSTFSESTFKRADLRFTRFEHENFSGKDLSRLNFHGAVFIKCKFQGCDITETNFRYADLMEADFRNVRVGGTNFTGAKLCFADFRDSRLPHFWKENAYLMNHLSAIFYKADLRGANFMGTRVDGIWVDENTKLKGALFIYEHVDELGFLPRLIKESPEPFLSYYQLVKRADELLS